MEKCIRSRQTDGRGDDRCCVVQRLDADMNAGDGAAGTECLFCMLGSEGVNYLYLY